MFYLCRGGCCVCVMRAQVPWHVRKDAVTARNETRAENRQCRWAASHATNLGNVENWLGEWPYNFREGELELWIKTLNFGRRVYSEVEIELWSRGAVEIANTVVDMVDEEICAWVKDDLKVKKCSVYLPLISLILLLRQGEYEVDRIDRLVRTTKLKVCKISTCLDEERARRRIFVLRHVHKIEVEFWKWLKIHSITLCLAEANKSRLFGVLLLPQYPSRWSIFIFKDSRSREDTANTPPLPAT